MGGRLRVDLDVDSPWYRVLRAGSPAQALQYAAVCYPSDANNRFSPLYEADVVFPAAYAGDQRETVLWEVVLRDIRHQGIRIVPEPQTQDRYLVAVKLTRRLAVLNLRRPEIENIVMTGKRSPRLSAALSGRTGYIACAPARPPRCRAKLMTVRKPTAPGE